MKLAQLKDSPPRLSSAFILISGTTIAAAFVSALNQHTHLGRNAYEIKSLINHNQFDEARLQISETITASNSNVHKAYLRDLQRQCYEKEQKITTSINNSLLKIEKQFLELRLSYQQSEWKDHKKNCQRIESCYRLANKYIRNCHHSVRINANKICDEIIAFKANYKAKENYRLAKLRRQIIDSLNNDPILRSAQINFQIRTDTIIVSLNQNKISTPDRILNFHNNNISWLLFNELNFKWANYIYFGNNGGESEYQPHILPIFNLEYKPENIINFVNNNCMDDA